jgi:hypothetical protein
VAAKAREAMGMAGSLGWLGEAGRINAPRPTRLQLAPGVFRQTMRAASSNDSRGLRGNRFSSEP